MEISHGAAKRSGCRLAAMKYGRARACTFFANFIAHVNAVCYNSHCFWGDSHLSNSWNGAKMEKKSKRGTSFLEYALLAALVGIVGAVGVAKYGSAIKDFFVSLAGKTAEVSNATK